MPIKNASGCVALSATTIAWCSYMETVLNLDVNLLCFDMLSPDSSAYLPFGGLLMASTGTTQHQALDCVHPISIFNSIVLIWS